jgi:hypothetical protein
VHKTSTFSFYKYQYLTILIFFFLSYHFTANYYQLISFAVWRWRSNSEVDKSDAEWVDRITSEHEEVMELLSTPLPVVEDSSYSQKRILCCPVSSSINLESEELYENKHTILSHILTLSNDDDDLKLISATGQTLRIVGDEIVCGDEYANGNKRVKITNVADKSFGDVIVSMYTIEKPFLGGIIDEHETSTSTHQEKRSASRQIAVLSSFPQTEQVFSNLDKFIKEIGILASHSHGPVEKHHFSRIKPSFSLNVYSQVENRSRELYEVLKSLPDEDRKIMSSFTLKGLEQLIETYIMGMIGNDVFLWISDLHQSNLLGMDPLESFLLDIKARGPASIGVAPELILPQDTAVSELLKIDDETTPLDKLAVLRRVVKSIEIPRDMDMDTDNLIMVIVDVIACSWPHYRNIFVDVEYISEFHFSRLRSENGDIVLCHFQVAANWIKEHMKTNRESA